MMAELREMSRGLHPAILSEGGLSPALRTLAQRSAVPVELHVNTKSRYPPPLEVAAVLRRLRGTHHTIKHADASHTEVIVEEQDSTLRLRVRDDGVGGAEPQQGSGLIGLRDRVRGSRWLDRRHQPRQPRHGGPGFPSNRAERRRSTQLVVRSPRPSSRTAPAEGNLI